MMKRPLLRKPRRKMTRTSEAPSQTDESLDPEALEGLVAQISHYLKRRDAGYWIIDSG